MSDLQSRLRTRDLEGAVRERHGTAQVRESARCCPTSYDPRLLEAVPRDVVDRDYGCGDPSRFLRPGETVLDLGSGTGNFGFLAAQIVSVAGRLVGVDMNDENARASSQCSARGQHAVPERLIELLAASPEVATGDITGGAPELNEAWWLGRHVVDRCNLTVLFV